VNDPRSASLLRAALGEAPLAEPTEVDFSDWLDLARRERVFPLLHQLVVASQPQISASSESTVRAAQIDVMGAAVRYEHDLLEVHGVLTAAGVEVAVLKGAATAHLDYASPSLREFGDVDLLVSPDAFAEACAALEAHDWRQAYVLPRHHERFTHAITFRQGRRVEIDLHQRIAHRSLGLLLPPTELLGSAEAYEIAGRTLRALSPVHRLIHAAVHTGASRGPYRRLSSVADVLVLAEALAESAERVLGQADEWRIRSLVGRTIEESYDSAGLEPPEQWRPALARTPRRRSVLVDRAYLSPRRRPAAEEAAYLVLLPGWRSRAAYLSGYFTTDPDYAERKKRSGLVAQVRYLWSRLRTGSDP
jgi:hypothetical protein